MRYAEMGNLGAAWTDWLTGAGAIASMIANIGAKGAADKAIAEGKPAEEVRSEARAAGIAAAEKLKAVEVGVPASRIALYAGGGVLVVGVLGGIAYLLLKR